MIEVKVIRVPGAVNTVAVEDGATVSDALSAASVTAEANEGVTVNGRSADGGTALANGDRVILAKSAKGNA